MCSTSPLPSLLDKLSHWNENLSPHLLFTLDQKADFSQFCTEVTRQQIPACWAYDPEKEQYFYLAPKVFQTLLLDENKKITELLKELDPDTTFSHKTPLSTLFESYQERKRPLLILKESSPLGCLDWNAFAKLTYLTRKWIAKNHD